MKTNPLLKFASPSLMPLVAALVLAGCAAPELRAPELDVPSGYKEAAVTESARWKPAQPAEAQPRGEWWKAFNDSTLDKLIEDATTANANLATAAARVKQARALAGVAEADRIPTVGVEFSGQRGRGSPVSLGLSQDTAVVPVTAWQGRLTASYEVDLFGRVANNISAAQADAQASEATYRSVLLALQADVAQTYFRLRAADGELAVLNETVRLREENVRINQRRYDLGDLGELDLARSKTELSTTRSDAIAMERQRALLEHALAVLLGKPAAAFSAQNNPLPESAVLPGIPAGLPSALLERRPDIAAAQRAMIAANARIGVARSAMFPALRLTGAGGYQSEDIADLFMWSSRTWVVGALLSLPIIDGGRNKANIARSEAALEESVADYRQSVLAAFAEVEDNLVGLRTLAGQAQSIDDAVASARRSAELANKLYLAGRSGYLDVLDAQRNLATVERSAVQLRGARATTTVALIRSLGGGW
ncbi:efflux transporter outer membrane subunit [Noviherbaspirillum cavernae]|uniref:Efflux transporter outer membrane subunit n=1 Tax=Noviherbaspirillum cavernae TaxID=2320862 RepID=A0A418X655_9BURK|nr:efflux transporter outer membrane subunit [Noviherbaspirillum cavernae]RJG07841.1 efflux transporter outer membrane subunit [Noviherbaspirillum cavernae]